MKFVIRRAVLGLIGIPVIAGGYLLGYFMLVMAGAEPSQSVAETINLGFGLGTVFAVLLTFAPQFSEFVSRAVGE